MEDIPVRERTLEFPAVIIRGFEGCEGHPLELDPDGGGIFKAEGRQGKGGWEIHTALPALGSRLFVVPKKEKIQAPRRLKVGASRSQTIGGKRWRVVLSEDNVLALDRPRCAIGTGRQADAEEILRVDRRIKKSLGLPYRGGRMAQPWTQKLSKSANDEKAANSVPVRLSYLFDVETVPSGSLFLALEQPERYVATLNGNGIDTASECGWWTDRSLKKLSVDPSFLRLGSNSLTLECVYDPAHPGLECVYLLGSFGVALEGTTARLTALPAELSLGDWVPQGLPFYSGSATYARSIALDRKARQRLILQIPEYRGVAVQIFVDGSSAGIIAWPPNEIDITEFVRSETGGKHEGAKKQRGEVQTQHEIGIQIVGHRRNSHGPLHHSEKWPNWTGPAQFVTEGDEWVEGYQLVPCGLMRSPRLVVRS